MAPHTPNYSTSKTKNSNPSQCNTLPPPPPLSPFCAGGKNFRKGGNCDCCRSDITKFLLQRRGCGGSGIGGIVVVVVVMVFY